ncbi:MAG TPA: hypothetical protein VIU16_07805 [Gaiellaceae bacterium]
MRRLFSWWAALLLLAVVLQTGFAGVAAFRGLNRADRDGDVGEDTLAAFWHAHVLLGRGLIPAALVLLALAALARPGQVARASVLFALMLAQLLLAWLARWNAALGYAHPLTALAVFALAVLIAQDAWRTGPAADRRGR